MPNFIDLSHTIENGMITYKGLPAPLICDYLSREESTKHYAEGTEFQIGKIEMVGNTGTYIDSPFHRYENGADLSELELDQLAHLDGVVIDVRENTKRAINKTYFQSKGIEGKAVLVLTGWAKHWKTDVYFEEHPYLTADSAEYLVENGAKLVGIDSLNIDDTTDLKRPVHTKLLGSNIPIVEHMCNLESLPICNFRFYSVPIKIKGFGTFPVRAFAEVL